MTKKDFCKSVALRSGLPVVQIEKVMDAVVSVASVNLAAVDEVRIPGLVVLRAKQHKERAARNPKTGAPCIIPACRWLSAKPTKGFAASVEKLASAAE